VDLSVEVPLNVRVESLAQRVSEQLVGEVVPDARMTDFVEYRVQ
jgi:hypothetical protein